MQGGKSRRRDTITIIPSREGAKTIKLRLIIEIINILNNESDIITEKELIEKITSLPEFVKYKRDSSYIIKVINYLARLNYVIKAKSMYNRKNTYLLLATKREILKKYGVDEKLLRKYENVTIPWLTKSHTHVDEEWEEEEIDELDEWE